MQRISVDKTNHAIHRIVIYPVDNVIHFSNNRDLEINKVINLIKVASKHQVKSHDCSQYDGLLVKILRGNSR